MNSLSSHTKFKIDIIKISTKELKLYLEYLLLDENRFSEEISEINQELIIRKLDYCKPLSDVLSLN